MTEKEPQVNDDDVAKVVQPTLPGVDLEDEQIEIDRLSASWGDELRAIVKLVDDTWLVETRPRLNRLVHAIETKVEVP